MTLLFALAACGQPDLTPAWAYDPIRLEGVGEGGAPAQADSPVLGFQTWQLYGPEWNGKYKEKFYVCAVLVGLDGLPLDACDAPGCAVGWEVEATVLETDCPDPALADDPLFLSLQRLALGAPAVGDDVPWPGATAQGQADYGDGWQVHGYAYPEVLDQGGAADPDWTGQEPFLFVPSGAFPL